MFDLLEKIYIKEVELKIAKDQNNAEYSKFYEYELKQLAIEFAEDVLYELRNWIKNHNLKDKLSVAYQHMDIFYESFGDYISVYDLIQYWNSKLDQYYGSHFQIHEIDLEKYSFLSSHIEDFLRDFDDEDEDCEDESTIDIVSDETVFEQFVNYLPIDTRNKLLASIYLDFVIPSFESMHGYGIDSVMEDFKEAELLLSNINENSEVGEIMKAIHFVLNVSHVTGNFCDYLNISQSELTELSNMDIEDIKRRVLKEIS